MGHHSLLLTLFVLVLNAVATLQQCTGPMDIMFVLDGSNAVGTDGNLRAEMAALTSVISTLNIGPGQILAGAVLSDGMNNQNVFLRDDASGIVSGINSWQYQGGNTRLDNGLQNAMNILASVSRASARKLIVLMVNGISSANVIQETIRLADQARSQNIHVFAIGIGSGGNSASQLANIANGQTNVRTTTSPTNLNTVLSQALPQACANAIGTQPQGCTYGTSDVYMVVDVSQTANGLSQNFAQITNGLSQFVRTLRSRTVSANNLRMGLISYSATASMALSLTSLSSQLVDTIIAAIPNNVFQGNTNSNLLSALQLITTQARAGDYRSYVVIMTPTDVLQSLALTTQVQRVQSLGYTVVSLPVQNGVQNFLTLQSLAQYSIPVISYANLGSVLSNFDRDHLCAGPHRIAQCNNQFDISFAVDASGTDLNAPNTFTSQVASLNKVVQKLDLDSNQFRAGAVTFGQTNTNGNVVLGNTVETFTAGTNAWRHLGGVSAVTHTGVQDAMSLLQNVGQQRTVPKAIVLIMNSQTSDVTRAINAVNAATRLGIHVFALASDNTASQARQITSTQNVVVQSSTTSFEDSLTDLMGRTCQALGTQVINPPVTNQPACDYGTADVYLVVDVSQTASGLSQNFGLLRNGLTQFISTLQSRSTTNVNLRVGLISYSDTAITGLFMTSVNFQTVTSSITAIPNNIFQGNSNLLSALQLITTRAPAGEYKSYVVVVTPTDVTQSQALTAQVQQVKSLGYTLVGLTVQNGNNNFPNLQNLVQYSMPVNGYTNLGTVLNNFERDHLCAGPRPNKMAGVCANSGHQTTGMAYMSHPFTCMHYVQCYYNAKKEFDLSVVRKCPAGLFWNAARSMCDSPKASQCPNDRCKDMCEPYAMKQNCRGYYKCKDGASMPSCCSDGYMFVEGKGCVMDKMRKCMDRCNMTTTYCEKPSCNKRPNWAFPGSYLFTSQGSSKWYTGPCGGKNFDALTCTCSAPKDHKCKADLMFDFKDAATVQQIQAGTKTGVTVTQGTYNNAGVTIPNRGMIHVDVASKRKNEPLTIKFRYREAASSLNSNDGTVLMASSYKCCPKCYGSLTMYIGTDFVGAVFKSRDGDSAHIDLPTKGLAPTEFKDVTLVYDDGYFALSVKGYYQQYMQKVYTPKNLYFPCGFDFGSTKDYNGFQGTFEMISVSTCTPAKLY